MDIEDFSNEIEGAINKAKLYLLSKYSINYADLQDILANAALNALSNLKQFKSQSKFDTWFLTIARRETQRILSKNSNENNILVPIKGYEELFWIEPEIEKRIRLEECSFILNEAINHLTPKQKEVMKLLLNDDYSFKAIAQLLNIPLNSVLSRCFCSKKKMKKFIKNRFPDYKI